MTQLDTDAVWEDTEPNRLLFIFFFLKKILLDESLNLEKGGQEGMSQRVSVKSRLVFALAVEEMVDELYICRYIRTFRYLRCCLCFKQLKDMYYNFFFPNADTVPNDTVTCT